MMNKELLDKLKFQAAAQVSPLLEGKEWQQVYSEKFAELIVRECAQVCVEVGDANSDIYPEFGNGAYFSANRVTQYFGVKE